VFKVFVTLITSKLIKSKMMNIVWLFQENSKKLQKYLNEKSSCFIIDTIKLINVDYNLHKIKRLIQINSEWMKRNQAQIKKRVNYLEQHEKTIIYDLRCVNSRIEMLVYDKQNHWMYIMKLTLKLKRSAMKLICTRCWLQIYCLATVKFKDY